MRIGVLTTWNTQCGIAEYSRYLVTAMRKIDDVDVVVLGSKNYDERKVSEDEEYVRPSFAVLPWNRYEDHSLDTEEILSLGLDVLHVQYEVLLYNQEAFNDLIHRFNGLKVLTYHDNCIPPTLPYDKFDILYTHRENVGFGEGYLLPMGVENRPPVVKTFGLGRSREDIIAQICLQNGWTFAKSFGEQSWVETESLFKWLRDSDAIVLYYDEVPSAGSSIAARVAISTKRPVFVSDTTWFREFGNVPNLTKVRDPDELEQALRGTFSNQYLEENNWDNIARWTVEDYREALNAKS